MAQEHLMKCSTFLVIREMQIKMNIRFHVLLVRMAEIKNSGDRRCWRGILFHCLWDCKVVQQLCKSVWLLLRLLDIVLPEDQAIQLLSIYANYVPTYIKDICCAMFIAALFIIARSWKKTQMSFNRGMDTK